MLPQRSNQASLGIMRTIPILAATILLLSIVLLGISASYGKQLANAPLDPSGVQYWHYHRWSNA